MFSQRDGARNSAADSNRWRALVFIALAQLLVVLDVTIVTIALPSAQSDLGMSDGSRQWAITAYAVTFGGLLLFGGRVADTWGRKRAFIMGLVGFGASSALGGAATWEGVLFGARALQGAFAAFLAPAALSLLSVLFTETRDRAKAFGVYGAVAGGGSALGLILGGFLTQYMSWRWTLFVSSPVALVAVFGVLRFVHEPGGGRHIATLDVPGALLSTLGLAALVFGVSRAESDGWTAPVPLSLFAAAIVLLATFVAVEAKTANPLLPMYVLLDRNRGGAYLAITLADMGMFGIWLFLTYYLQVVKGYSPLTTGLAFLPATVGMVLGSQQIAARLMTRVAPRWVMASGALTAAAGTFLLTQIRVDSSYLWLILPAQLMVAFGMGSAIMPGMSLATYGTQPRDAGIASAMANTAQQLGGGIGTALLNTIASLATASYVASHSEGPVNLTQGQDLVEGYRHAFWWAGGLLAAAAVTAIALVNASRPVDQAEESASSLR